jgi:DNA-binding Lrp family transcriptional regulator
MRLKETGLIRRLGAVFDARQLGYASTLVAAKVPPDRVDVVAARVSRLSGVTHNYLRDGDYNLWFTLTARSPEEIDSLLTDLKTATGVAALHSLPALAMYKRQVFFNVADDSPESAPLTSSASPVPLDSADKALVRALQDDLPTTSEPFAAVADTVGMSVAEVLSRVNAWLASGVIRRIGAVVAHRALGFAANGMAVFAVPDDSVDAAGALLAAQTEVSHCYRRPPLPDWPYNLYAMVHGKSAGEVNAVVSAAAGKLHVADYRVLFSTKEFKKTSMRYFGQ